MLARLDETYCSAQAKRRNGTTQYVTATTTKCSHTIGSRGSRLRVMSMITPSVTAPNTRRAHATCPNETPSRPTFMNRKLAPQTSPMATNCRATFTLERLAAAPDIRARESDRQADV